MLLLLLACQPATDSSSTGEISVPLSPLPEPVVSQTPISTVFLVEWTSDLPSIGFVEFGDDDQYGRQTPADPVATLTHKILVAGLAAGAEQHWRIAENRDDGQHVGEDHTLQTEDPPPETAFSVDIPAEDWKGYILAPLTEKSKIVIFNERGQPVWWFNIDSGAMLSQARMVDGLIWFNQFSREDQGPDVIRGVSLDFADDQFLQLTDSHHDFLMLEDRVIYLARDKRTGYDGKAWIGDRLMQRLPDGATTQLWSTWDSISTEVVSDTFYTDGRDWTHCNAIGYWEEERSYLISSKTQSAVFSIDADGAGLNWIAGGVQNDMTLSSGDGFGKVHGVTYMDGQLWLFDNGMEGGNKPSSARAYTVDAQAHSYAETWHYEEGSLVNQIHGNVEPLPDGSRLASWGDEGRMMWLSADQQVLGHWSGANLGYVHWLASLGGPVP